MITSNVAPRSDDRGFSLIELLAALALFAILMGLAMPGFSTMMSNWRLRGSAETMAAGLQAARTEAIRRNAPVSFTLGTDNRWTIALASGAAVEAGGGADVGTPATVKITPNSGTAPVTVTFNNRGALVGGTATGFRIEPASGTCDDQRCLQVNVSAGGQVRTCDPKVTATGDTRRCLPG